MYKIDKLLFKLNSIVYDIDPGDTRVLVSTTPGLYYDSTKRMFYADTHSADIESHLYAWYAMFEEALEHGDLSKVFLNEVIRAMKINTDNIEKYGCSGEDLRRKQALEF